MKIFLSIFLISLLSGCAGNKVINWNSSSIVNTMPRNIKEAKFSIFILDKEKNKKIETVIIQNQLIEAFVARGMVFEDDPKHRIPNYIILYDYASDYGISTQYEHVFTIIVYALASKPTQVFKARLKINSTNNDTIKNITLGINEVIEKAFGKSEKEIKKWKKSFLYYS